MFRLGNYKNHGGISRGDLDLIDCANHTLGGPLYVQDSAAAIVAPVAHEPLRAWLKSWGRLAVGGKAAGHIGESHLEVGSAYFVPTGQISAEVEQRIAHIHLESFVRSRSIACLDEWVRDSRVACNMMSFNTYQGVYSVEKLLDLHLNTSRGQSEPMGSGAWTTTLGVGTRGVCCATPVPELVSRVSNLLNHADTYVVLQKLSGAVVLGSCNLHYAKFRKASQYKRYSQIAKFLLARHSIASLCDPSMLDLRPDAMPDYFVWREFGEIVLVHS